MTLLHRLIMILLLASLTLFLVTPCHGQEFKSHEYYVNWCKANPTNKACVNEALGGTDSLEKERNREENGSYYEFDDDREYAGQDMEDPRESL